MTAYGHPGGPSVPQGYGYPGYPGQAPYPVHDRPSNGFGVTSLVLGILAVVGCSAAVFATALGIGAVVFGALGKGKANRGESTNGGMALAGIILGAVGIVLGALMTVVVLIGLMDRGPLDDSGYDAPSSVLQIPSGT
ncbi:DUF4190 domain-containing protein [Streptomyces sp. NPDC051567]|uniref:DUF4190 domain-containing protein n=1 Tax=Streptomyces sp. NPDC051567 TaxID=3365660 RepID=UPI003794F708